MKKFILEHKEAAAVLIIIIAVYVAAQIRANKKKKADLDDVLDDIETQQEIDQVTAEAALNEGQLFDPQMWKNNQDDLLDETTANAYAIKLKKAVSGWGTDESAIMAVFDNLTDKFQISQIADQYNQEFNASLLHDLVSDLNDEELLQLRTKIDLIN